jgi:transcriptional regulator GlxA family with amidase domain
MRIAVHVFDGAEELDLVGPWEILGVWKMLADEDPDGPDIELVSVAREAGVVTCAKGLRLLPDRTWDDLGPIDLLVYPGGRGTRAQLGDAAIRGWLHGLKATGTLLTSVCTGSLVFADAGLLDGRPATTHWASLDRLEELGTDIEVRPDDRFVDDGDVVTAAGVSAGIDAALHLVARLESLERAREVRRYAQYDPEPPV